MDFDDTVDEAAWRAQVRDYLTAHRRELGVRGHSARRMELAQAKAAQRCLYDGGLVGLTWPVDCGGAGGSPMQQAIVEQEMAAAGVPGVINMIGIGMCGPTIIAHGSEQQKQRYLRRLLRADDIWCQLFSEPGAGSDLAGLRTRAVRTDDGDWRVSGQKVWTTVAHLADYGILLTRTNTEVPKHRGLTMFVVDMHAPGVTVRPLRQMSGASDFNEVFFDDVRIADGERLGAVDDGWRVAITTLMSERMSIGGGGADLGIGLPALTEAVRAALPQLPADRAAIVRQQFGQAVVASLGVRYTGYRRLSALSRGSAPGPEASAGKLAGTRAARDVADLGVRLLGPQAVFAAGPDGERRWQDLQAALPGLAIAGGTDEILRNIIGERVLGLPPEPRPDKAGAVGGSR